MSVVENERILGELSILDKIVYRHSNQHGKTKYFQRLKHVRGMMRKFLLALKNPAPMTVKQYDHHLDILLSTAEIFTVLLGQSYFMPLAITVLAVLSRLLAFVRTKREARLATVVPNKVQDSSRKGDVGFEDTGGSDDGHALPTTNTSAALPTLDTSIDSLAHRRAPLVIEPGLLPGARIPSAKKKQKKKKKRKRKNDAIDDIFGF